MARYLAVVPILTEGQHVAVARGGADAADRPSIPPGKRLVAVVNNGQWQLAIDVTFGSAYENLCGRCRAGVWKEMRLYIIGEERAHALEDARRVLMNGEPVPEPNRH